MLMTDLILQEILRKEFGSYLLEEDFVIQHAKKIAEKLSEAGIPTQTHNVVAGASSYACGKIPGLNK